MELESIMLCEISRSEKDKYHEVSFLCGTNGQNKQTSKIETDSDRKQTDSCHRGEGCRAGWKGWRDSGKKPQKKVCDTKVHDTKLHEILTITKTLVRASICTFILKYFICLMYDFVTRINSSVTESKWLCVHSFKKNFEKNKSNWFFFLTKPSKICVMNSTYVCFSHATYILVIVWLSFLLLS